MNLDRLGNEARLFLREVIRAHVGRHVSKRSAAFGRRSGIDLPTQTPAPTAGANRIAAATSGTRERARLAPSICADAGSVDRKVFFTKDGTSKGVGRSAHDVLLAITHITTKLADSKSPVRDASFWYAQFDATMKALAPAVAFANDAQSDRQSWTPEVEAARQAWLNVYTSAKCIVEGALRLLGRVEQLPVIFYDLRVSPGTKLTALPPDEPIAAREGDEDDQNDA